MRLRFGVINKMNEDEKRVLETEFSKYKLSVRSRINLILGIPGTLIRGKLPSHDSETGIWSETDIPFRWRVEDCTESLRIAIRGWAYGCERGDMELR